MDKVIDDSWIDDNLPTVGSRRGYYPYNALGYVNSRKRYKGPRIFRWIFYLEGEPSASGWADSLKEAKDKVDKAARLLLEDSEVG